MRSRSSDSALRVGEVAQRRGVLGRSASISCRCARDRGWQHFAIEINLRKGGTTHTFQMLQFPTRGRYDPERAAYVTPAGDDRCYYATDNVVSPACRRLTPQDLFEIAGQRDLRFDDESQTGVVFMLVGALSEFGKLGVVLIDIDREAARRRFRGTVAVLDGETATPPAA